MTNEEKRKAILTLLYNPDNLSIEDREVKLCELIPDFLCVYHLEHEQPAHCYNVFDHIIHVVDDMPNNDIGKLAALFHDLGKGKTKKLGVDNVFHYHGHPNISYEMTLNIMKDLEFDEDTILTVTTMVKLHDTYLDRGDYNYYLEWSSIIGTEYVDTMLSLQRADLMNHAVHYYNKHLHQLEASHERIRNFKNQHTD